MNKDNKLILYKDAEGRVSVNVRFADEDVWHRGLWNEVRRQVR